MKLSLFATLCVIGTVQVAADHNTTSSDDYEILDELISINATSLDDDQASSLDFGLELCAESAKNHGKFVSCAKKFLRSFRLDIGMDDAEFKLIKAAIVKSDIGKTAVELIEDDTDLELDDDAEEALDKCERKAASFVRYQKCARQVLKKLVKKGGLKKEDAKKIRQTVKNNDKIKDEIDSIDDEDSEDDEDDADDVDDGDSEDDEDDVGEVDGGDSEDDEDDVDEVDDGDSEDDEDDVDDVDDGDDEEDDADDEDGDEED